MAQTAINFTTADTLRDSGRSSEAVNEYYQLALSAQKAQDKDSYARAMQLAGVTLKSLVYGSAVSAKKDAAIRYFSEAYKAATEQKDLQLRAKILSDWGDLYTGIGDFSTASTYLSEAIELFKSIDDFRGIASAKKHAAKLFRKNRNFEAALQATEEALSALGESPNGFLHGSILLERSAALFMLNRDDEALDDALSALSVFTTEENIKRYRVRQLQSYALLSIIGERMKVKDVTKFSNHYQKISKLVDEELLKVITKELQELVA